MTATLPRVYLALLLMLCSTLAMASEPPMSQLTRYFGYQVDISADVPSTSDSINVIQLEVSAPKNIRNPGIARFTINDAIYTDYHYAGYEDGKHNYLVAIPKKYHGNVTVGAYVDERFSVNDSYSKSRDALVRNTVVLGANDIVLVVDSSGSMSSRVSNGQTRMALARDVVNTIGPQLEAEGNNVAVIDFDSSVSVRIGLDQPFTSLSFSDGGGTNTSDAIRTARNLLNGRKSAGKIILTITDAAGNGKSQVQAVQAMKDDGWAIAGLGMGTTMPSYYDIRKNVSDGNASNLLGQTILNLVQTAKDQIRDVNQICSGNKCRADDNDTQRPAASMRTLSQCRVGTSGADYEFTITDAGEAGLRTGSIAVSVDFGGKTYSVPTTVVSQLRPDQGLPPVEVVRKVNAGALGADIKEAFRVASYGTDKEGGRQSFTFEIDARDYDNNTLHHAQNINPMIFEDKKPPTIKIFAGNKDGDGSKLRQVSDASITLADDSTGIAPSDVDFALTVGGKRVSFVLDPTDQAALSDDACVARYPLGLVYNSGDMLNAKPALVDILMSAYETGDQITFEVQASDFARNRTVTSKKLSFVPEVLTTDDVRVPGIDRQFNTGNNSPVMRITARDAAFKLGGSVRYYARLLTPDDVPLMVNGIPVNHDAAVELGSFSLQKADSIDLDIASAVDGAEGESTLVLMPVGDNSRVIRVPVKVWQPDVELVSSNWQPVQLFERAAADLKQRDKVACQLTGVQLSARYADPINNPKCLIEWTQLPTDAYGLEDNHPGMRGFIPQPGKHDVAFQVVLYDTDGTRFVMQEGSGQFDVVPAKDVMEFSVGSKLDNTYRMVRDVNGGLQQDAGPHCSALTTDSDYAMDLSSYNKPGCLITWTAIPEGIETAEWTDQPDFRGKFSLLEGDAHFAWTLSGYSTSGQRIDIMDGNQTIPLKDPPKPTITVDGDHKIAEGLYTAAITGGSLGDYRIEYLSSELDILQLENGAVVQSDQTYSGYRDTATYRGRLLLDEKPLWARTPLEIQAKYHSLPSLAASKQLDVLSVPGDKIRPEATMESEKVLNTDDINVKAWIGDPYEAEAGYDAKTMGDWEIRLLNYIAYDEQTPITEYQDINAEGETSFTFNIGELDSTYMRVMPEARLKSPVPEYQRTEMGGRPIYVTVLRGGAIDASIQARRLAGEAPLGLIASLDLDNSLDRDALGDVTWQVREPGGDWESIESDRDIHDRLMHTFETGKYLLRAKLQNRYSGAKSTTETIEVDAFNVPRATIEGPTNAFIGDTAHISIAAEFDGKKVDPEDLAVEWSLDRGETWQEGDTTLDISRDQEERVYINARVRLKDSPADVDRAYDTPRSRVSFRPIREPRVSIYGDRVIEAGKPVEWRGLARLPYPHMDNEVKGRFVLPDGTKVDGETAQYIARNRDALEGRIEVSYEAWVVDFKDKGAVATDTRRIKAWKYEWPEWEFYTRMRTTQVPADLSVVIRNRGGHARYLEGVEYEWQIPEGVEVTEARRPESRVLHFAKPGHYTIGAVVTDERGHASEMTYEIEAEAPDPWKISFRMSKSNAENHAPLELRIIPDIGGGHPYDRVRRYQWFVNGEEIKDASRYAALDLDEGTYQLALQIHTSLGQDVKHVETLQVLPNQPPTCSLDSRGRGSGWRFTAECDDPDGRVQDHVWTLNGEQLAVSSSRISVRSRQDATVELSLHAIDNGGSESNEVHWQGSLKGTEEQER